MDEQPGNMALLVEAPQLMVITCSRTGRLQAWREMRRSLLSDRAYRARCPRRPAREHHAARARSALGRARTASASAPALDGECGDAATSEPETDQTAREIVRREGQLHCHRSEGKR